MNLNPNILVEYIFDSDNFIAESYHISINTLNGNRFFSQSETTNTLPNTTNNFLKYNLFELDSSVKQWAEVNTSAYTFLQVQNYPGNVPHLYDIVKIHFPINYDFENFYGIFLKIYVLDVTGKVKIPLTQFFYDKTNPNRSLDLTAPPFLFKEKLWGKNITLQIPSANALALDNNHVTGLSSTNLPTLGSINASLVGANNFGVSVNSPIFFDFSFINNVEVNLNQPTYFLSDFYSTSIPQIPEYQSISVSITESTQGDWFDIVGLYGGTASGFATFLTQQFKNGNVLYVMFDVDVYEKNVLTDSLQFFVQDNFSIPMKYRPIIINSTTTAVIDVTMKLINQNDNSTIIKRSNYVLSNNKISKYARKLNKINVSNIFSPKIYNAQPAQLSISNNNKITEKQKVNVPYPVAIDRYNVIARNANVEIQDTTYYGNGQLQILLYPSDNVISIVIAQTVTNQGVEPLDLVVGSRITLTFKSDGQTLDVELYYDSGEVDLKNGKLVFRILEKQMSQIKTIKNQGFDQFYIILRPENRPNTIIYAGRYLLYDSI